MEPYEILARLAEHGVPPEGEVALKMSVGLEDTLERFKEETLSFISGGGAELRFCYGPYGRGKTHLLKSLQALARSHGFVTAYIDCRAEQSPFSSLEETYRMIVSNIEPPNENYGVGIEAVVRAGLDSFAEQQSAIGRLRSERRLELGFRNLVLAYVQAILEVGDIDLHNDLETLLRAGTSFRINMNSLYRRYSGIPRPLGKLSKRNANLWLRSLASLPSVLNYPGFVILFDETERSHHMSKWQTRKQHQHMVNIRNLIDHVAMGNFSGCAFCFAVVEEFIEIADSSLGALAQRIQRMHSEKRNPRAVWTSLDELTFPAPDDQIFFRQLGNKVLNLAVSAGLEPSSMSSLKNDILKLANISCEDISSGAVRQFVKSAAAIAAQRMNS